MSSCQSCKNSVEYGIKVREFIFCSIECFMLKFQQLEALKLLFFS